MLIPMMLSLQLAQAGLPADSIDRLRSEARRSAANYERLSRRLIPVRYGVDGSHCDEIVGRFCLMYDTGRPYVPGPENGRITDARRSAIEAQRAAFAHMPADFETAAPLVRYLVEDERAGEAVSAARLFEIASGDSIWGPLLRGFAEHAATNDSAAERLFRSVLQRMPEDERREILDVEWVIGNDDGKAWKNMASAERSDFETAFWALADPFYLTPGNESWNEHVARHVWSRMLERAPQVGDMLRWGKDLEELTVRYGVPSARTREPGRIDHEGALTEHYDPDQLAYTPNELAGKGPPPAPLPGRPWELDRERSRTGYAPATVRRAVFLPHQATRFPNPNGFTLQIDGLFVMDSVARPVATGTDAGLFVLDDLWRVVRTTTTVLPVSRDTARFHFSADLPVGSFVYSLEAMETGTRLGARARYAIDSPDGDLLLSDPLVAFPWSPAPAPARREDPVLLPRADLVIGQTDTIGLYAEVRGLSPGNEAMVRLSIEPASGRSLPARVVSWLGNRLRLSNPPAPTHLQWSVRADDQGAAVLAVEIFPAEKRDGDQVIVLQVTDAATRNSSTSRRIIRVGSPPSLRR